MYEQPFNPYAANLAAVKNCLSRPKVLVLGILYIVSAVLGVIYTLLINANTNLIAQTVFSYLESYGISMGSANDAIGSLNSNISASTIMSAAVSAIITLLFAAGFILMYVKSRNLSPESSPKSGVTILYVFAVISLVLTILGVIGAVIVVLLFSYLFIAQTSGSGSSESVVQSLETTYGVTSGAITAVLIILGVIVLLAIAYALFIAINRVRFYGSVRNSMQSIELENKGASPYGAACVINAIFTAFSITGMFTIFSVLTSSHVYTPIVTIFVISLLNTVLSAVMLIVEAAIAFSYKKHIDNIKFGYSDAGDQGFHPGIPYDARANGGYGRNSGTHFADSSPRRDVYSVDQSRQGVNPYNDGFSDAASPQRQSAPPVCPFCGAPDDGSTFCSNCGAKLK